MKTEFSLEFPNEFDLGRVAKLGAHGIEDFRRDLARRLVLREVLGGEELREAGDACPSAGCPLDHRHALLEIVLLALLHAHLHEAEPHLSPRHPCSYLKRHNYWNCI